MSVHESLDKSLGDSLAEVWAESGGPSALTYHRLGNVATRYTDQPVTSADLVIIGEQLDNWREVSKVASDEELKTGGQVVETGARLYMRRIDTDAELPSTLKGYAQRGKRHIITQQSESRILTLTKTPILASDITALYRIERDIRADSLPALVGKPKGESPAKRKDARSFQLSARHADVARQLFTPWEELLQKSDTGIRILEPFLARASTLNGMNRRQLYTRIFKEGIVEMPALPSTKDVQFTPEENALLSRLPLPRVKGEVQFAENSDEENLNSVCSKLGAKTQEQAFFICLRDDHIVG